ncbi:MAG: type II toxin-antitoxin system prevent-host-death family antitoxin [Caulobacteraceae bacterium]|nr:type II toxin-antitoxin system prevent-host-death family antitoxin [Caulobacteraceae bacterium]
MQQFTIHAAKTNLSKLIEAALAGEEVVIARGSTPVVRLVPVARGAFQVGLLKGRLGHGPDFFEPQDGADLRLWEGGAE